MGCPNGCTTRSGMCEACVQVLFDRLTAQLTMEQTASTRTIEHLVAKKDVIEGERDAFRIALERVESHMRALETERSEGQAQGLLLLATVKTLQEERDHWHSHYDAAVGNWNLMITERDALKMQVQALEQEIVRREKVRIRLSTSVDRILAISDDDDPVMVGLRDAF